MKKRTIAGGTMAVALLMLIIAGGWIYRTLGLLPEMFRLNAELQSEGYYMGEFEFKMVGIVYYLDKGEYWTALRRLDRLHRQMKNRDGLVKFPRFFDKNEELDFYLGLQNPKTGAFMDAAYPLCTYIGPTLNVVDHVKQLAHETGRPLQLNYPLFFLEQIDNGEKLNVFLDDLASAGYIASRLPKTPYILGVELAYYADLENAGLYAFSPEWKRALAAWYYQNQDEQTGYWGPRSRSSGELLDSGDLVATSHVVRLYVDDRGENKLEAFPLRYHQAMFATTLKKMDAPMPDNLAEQHDWSLTTFRALRILTNFLWNGSDEYERVAAEKQISKIVKEKFEKFYIPAEGAFRYYSSATEASLDGTEENVMLMENIGALSQERQERLWGKAEQQIGSGKVFEVRQANEIEWKECVSDPAVNSIRLYRTEPYGQPLLEQVAGFFYPRQTAVPDILELMPKLNRWLENTPQTMGNWVSRENLAHDLQRFAVPSVPVLSFDEARQMADDMLQNRQAVVLVGFDVFNRPICKWTLRRAR